MSRVVHAPTPRKEPRRITRRQAGAIAAVVLIVGGVVGGVVATRGSSSSSQAFRTGGGGPGADSAGIQGTDPITGRHVSLAQFDGRPVVINVWASWCSGCNQEAADLARFAARHPGVTVLGIDTQDTTGGARAFYRKWHWRHPSIADPRGNLAARVGLQGLPTTYFLDAGHRVVGQIVGAGTLASFERGLRLAQHRA